MGYSQKEKDVYTNEEDVIRGFAAQYFECPEHHQAYDENGRCKVPGCDAERIAWSDWLLALQLSYQFRASLALVDINAELDKMWAKRRSGKRIKVLIVLAIIAIIVLILILILKPL